MDLSALQKYLKSKGDPLTLSASDSRLPKAFQDFLDTVPDRQVTLSPGSNGIALQGSTLTVSGACTDKWLLQGMEDVSATLCDMTITIDNSNSPPTIDGVARASLPFTGSVHAPVLITALHQDDDPWQVRLAKNAAGVTPTELLLLGKIGTLPFDIPPDLDVLSRALTVNEDKFQITFYPNTAYEVRYSFGLSAPQARWTPIKDLLSFDGIDLDAFVMTNSMSAVLTGRLHIDKVGVDVGVGLNTGEDWVAFVKPSQGDAFPGLAALATWVGGGPLSGDVLGGFKNVDFNSGAFDAAIAKVSVGFNWKKVHLNYVDIQSLLTVGALQLDVVLRLPDIGVIGSLHGDKPVQVKKLLSAFGLQTDDIPDDLSVISANFSAQPGNSYYSAGMTVDKLWQAEPISLEEVSLLVSYHGADGFTGQFNCQLDIADKLKLDLAAEYAGAGAGWHFSGGTEVGSHLDIGDVLSELAKKFGIGDVPQPIKSLSLTRLDVSYETGTKNFSFTCEGGFAVADKPVTLTITIDVAAAQPGAGRRSGAIEGNKGYSATFGGHVTFSGLDFDLIFDTQSTGTDVFLAAYDHAGHQASIKVHDLVAKISDESAKIIPRDLAIDLKNIKFIFYKAHSQDKQFVFGLGLDADFSLSDLPLIGAKLPADASIGVKDLQALYASAAFTKLQIDPINKLVPQSVQPLPADGVTAGLHAQAAMQFGDATPQTLSLEMAQNKQSAALLSASPQPTGDATSAPTPAVKWFTLQKSFGPVHFQKIGVQYREGALWFLLDAALSTAKLTLSLDGLSCGSPISRFQPQFNLDGLGIDFHNPPVEIGGAFLRQQVQGGEEYDGAAVIKTKALSLSAIGSYAKLDGHPSLFIYATLDRPMGGPPFFFAEGLAAGFGYNRALQVPSIDQVADFPLVATAVNQPPGPMQGGTDTLTKELEALQAYIPPSTGEDFLAVGVKFNSFKQIDSFALLTAEFGHRFALNILGLSTAVVPAPTEGAQAPDRLAEVQMAVNASYIPSEGFLGVSAQLTSGSYILSKKCHLTGGFAFYSWFAGDHGGDFALTLGGYNPRYEVPAYYPKVPRLGFNWRVSDALTIKGGGYFALVPSAFMAGGNLQATWQSGSLKAWFNADADFLIAWKPYHYDAQIQVGVGVSYTYHFFGTHHITADVGAGLHLWGPDFSGTAYIHLAVVSFHVTFGSGVPQRLQPIGWADFKSSFLPADSAICGIAVDDGLLKAVGKTWIINPKDFSLTTNSLIPATAAEIANTQKQPDLDGANTDLGIAPMDLGSGINSTHTITIIKDQKPAAADFAYAPVLKNVPASLWGTSASPDLNGAPLVDNALCGFAVKPAKPPKPGATQAIDRANLRYETTLVRHGYDWDTLASFAAAKVQGKREINDTIVSEATITARDGLLAELGFQPDRDVALTDTTADAFLLAPQIGTLS